MHANLGFMNRRVDVLNRFVAVAMEFALGVRHMISCATQRFERVFHTRMRRHWHRNRRSSHNRCHWRFGTGSRC